VHWGNVISNLVVSLDIDQLVGRKPYAARDRISWHIGEPGRGAADPGRVLVCPDGEIALLLSGVNEVGLTGRRDVSALNRIEVGQGPSDLVMIGETQMLIANRFSDSISIIDTGADSAKQVGQISLGLAPEPSLAERGERLFFDARLSHDGWMSCHSCHTDGHANAQLNDNMSDGSFGAPKRVLSLLGVSETAPWAWNGDAKTLHGQVSKSVSITMQGAAPPEQVIDALVAYMVTLRLPSPVDRDSRNDGDDHAQALLGGRQLFQSLECARCHRPPTFTTPEIYDVGMEDTVGNRKFNPPSLRGVGRRRVLFHDGRARSLRDVVANYKHQLPRELTTTEVEQLVRFLGSI
jgi:hypothetical protein